jgi:hypothetical protein
MPKKRKKNNELERTKRLFRAQLGDCVVVFIGGNAGKSKLYSRKRKMCIQVNSEISHILHNFRWPWTTLMSVLCRDELGKEYIRNSEANAGHCAEVRYEDMAEALNDAHFDLVGTAVEKHVLNVGWIAAPHVTSFDEAEAMDIYQRCGGFYHLAKWEQPQ